MNFHFFKLLLLPLAFTIAFSSCTKEESLFSKNQFEKKEGDNDEPFILGFIQDGSSEPVFPATVVLFEEGETEVLNSVATDYDGSYSINTGYQGYFYVQVFVNGIMEYESDVVQVTTSTNLSITLP